MIDNVKSAWKFWSVQLAVLLAAIAALEPCWPTLAEVLPPHWVEIGATAIVVARVLRQSPKKDSHEGA